MHITLFPDRFATSLTYADASWEQVIEHATSPQTYPNKSAMPLIKLARFGTAASAKGCLRTERNMLAVSGVELDYDGCVMQPSTASFMLQCSGIQSVIYTSPSSTPDAPRWRILAPLTSEYPVSARREFVGRINAVLGGVMANESFTSSQSFYIGRCAGAHYETYITDGMPIDMVVLPPVYPVSAPIAAGSVREASPVTAETLVELRSALTAIPADAYEDWIAVGVALSSIGADGFALWSEWSATSPKHDPDVDLERWATFSPDRTDHRTIFARAQRNGWVNPKSGTGRELDTLSVFGSPDAMRAAPVTPVRTTGRMVNGSTIVTAEQQLQMWAGYVYVAETKVIISDTGFEYDQSSFNAWFNRFSFVINDEGRFATSAWDAFTGSKLIVQNQVHHSTFKPDRPAGDIWIKDGRSYVNSYRELGIKRTAGDATPFLDHMAKVLPVQRDRDILLSYMAAIVQYPGVKFQWVPIIQGAEGNGKSLFSRCVAEAVGMQYSHFARPSELAKQFNSWLVGKIFVGVEDIWYPDSRTEIIETLKPMITNERQPIRAMQQAERTMDICANFLINSNHKDAIKKTAHDRRWCVMFCAQQEYDDLVRDGMTNGYFPKLYEWLRNGGYEIVSELLHTYKIPDEFGLPCLLDRAPITSSTDEAIQVGMGNVENEILEAIAENRHGFCGGWVCSLELDKLLKDNRMEKIMPRTKRRELLKSLGYDWHPALDHGRLNNPIPGYTTKPVIFCKKNHPLRSITGSGDVGRAYVAAQSPSATGLLPVFGMADGR